MDLPEKVWMALCEKHGATKDKNEIKHLVMLSKKSIIEAVKQAMVPECDEQHNELLPR